MPAGQTLVLHWAVREIPLDRVLQVAAPEDLRAGRTEVREVAVEFQYEHDTARLRRLALAGTPGRARLVQSPVLPPGRYEPLPVRANIELQAVALTDHAEDGARIRWRDGRSRLAPPAASQPGGPRRRHAALPGCRSVARGGGLSEPDILRREGPGSRPARARRRRMLRAA